MLYETEPEKPKRDETVIRLKPKTVFEVMDGTFRIYRENAATLLMLAALLIVPLSVVSGLFTSAVPETGMTEAQLRQMTPDQMNAFLGDTLGLSCIVILVAVVLGLVQAVVLNGTFTTIASESLFGNRLTLREAWEMTRPRLGKLFSAYLSFYVMIFLVSVVLLFLSALCPLLLVVYAFVFYVAITAGSLIAPVSILEGRGGDAIARAHLLAKSRFWQVLGLSLLIGLVSFVITLLLQGLFGLLLNAPALQAGVTGVVATITTSSIVSIVVTPLIPLAMTQMYYDARIRKEGLDVALAAIGADARPDDVRPVVSDEPFISSQDVLNMAAMIGIVVVLTLLGGTVLAGFLDVLVPGMGDLQSFGSGSI